MAVEQASYQVLIQEGPFELRLYEPMVVVSSPETDVNRGDGFNRLFNYINGNNKESKKIAMTAPVINYLDDHNSPTTFVMPKQFSLEDIPQPNDPALQPKEIPERQVAVLSFSGATTSIAINMKKTELLEWVKEKQLSTIGVVELARYNPPYTPTFFRKNELMIEVKQ